MIILDNVGLGQNHLKITASIIGSLAGEPIDPAKRSVAESLYKTVIGKTVAAAVAD